MQRYSCKFMQDICFLSENPLITTICCIFPRGATSPGLASLDKPTPTFFALGESCFLSTRARMVLSRYSLMSESESVRRLRMDSGGGMFVFWLTADLPPWFREDLVRILVTANTGNRDGGHDITQRQYGHSQINSAKVD